MKSHDLRAVITQQLSLESEPLSLSELIRKLDKKYNDRTVRRLLNRLVEEGSVSKSGTTKAVKYFVIKHKLTESNKETQELSSCFGPESLRIISKIKRPIYERSPCSYNQDWVNAYRPNKDFYLSKRLREQLFQAGRRAGDQDPAGTFAHQIFNRLLIDLSYNSSRLEGNTYSLIDTERLILFGDSPEGKLNEEKIMILNHKDAIRYLVENAQKIKLNKQTIFTLHYLLADSLLEPRYTGKVRDHFVRISGSTYMLYEDPRKLEEQLEILINKAAQINDPFEQSLFLLIHISYLQAFADVNKRTARLGANIALILNNLVPLSFNDINRDDYASALIAIYELQAVQPIVDLFVFSYMRTCISYDTVVKSIEYDAIRARFRQQRREMIREIIEHELVGDALDVYIKKVAGEKIPQDCRADFMQDVMEDLEYMDNSRIVGLAITPSQLEKWLKLYSLANTKGGEDRG